MHPEVASGFAASHASAALLKGLSASKRQLANLQAVTVHHRHVLHDDLPPLKCNLSDAKTLSGLVLTLDRSSPTPILSQKHWHTGPALAGEPSATHPHGLDPSVECPKPVDDSADTKRMLL